jgi:hypothetical protein
MWNRHEGGSDMEGVEMVNSPFVSEWLESWMVWMAWSVRLVGRAWSVRKYWRVMKIWSDRRVRRVRRTCSVGRDVSFLKES